MFVVKIISYPYCVHCNACDASCVWYLCNNDNNHDNNLREIILMHVYFLYTFVIYRVGYVQ